MGPVQVWKLPYQDQIAARITTLMNDEGEKARVNRIIKELKNEKIHGEYDYIRQEVVKEFLGKELLPNFRMPSDHFPIAAIIRYTPPEPMRQPGQVEPKPSPIHVHDPANYTVPP